jgi:hypothetical protein
MSSTPILRRQKLPKLSHRNVPIMGLPPVEILPPIIHTLTTKEIVPFDVTPIAMEPIINGSAVIRTVVIQGHFCVITLGVFVSVELVLKT